MGNRFLLTRRNLWFYDYCVVERSLALVDSCYTVPIRTNKPLLQALAQLPTPSPD